MRVPIVSAVSTPACNDDAADTASSAERSGPFDTRSRTARRHANPAWTPEVAQWSGGGRKSSTIMNARGARQEEPGERSTVRFWCGGRFGRPADRFEEAFRPRARPASSAGSGDRPGTEIPATDTDEQTDPVLIACAFHEGRHTHRTRLSDNGISDIGRAARLGQKLPGVADVYEHLTPEMKRRTPKVLEARWQRGSGPFASTGRTTLLGWVWPIVRQR